MSNNARIVAASSAAEKQKKNAPHGALKPAALLLGAGLGGLGVAPGAIGEALGFLSAHAHFNLTSGAFVVTVETAARGVAAGYGGVLVHAQRLKDTALFNQ